jgi:hypothetical protein
VEPIDVVYTWVDDRFPGYLELRDRYAGTSHDRNPNRTRDNLDLLKYSLRSLAAFAPWVRHVYLVSCRPQVPSWLAPPPGMTVVHHDAFMDPAVLPTFNSFAILSFLNQVPNASRRFLYIEDDMLFGRPVTPADFIAPDGRIRVFQRLGRTRPAQARHSGTLSPWNTGLAHSNHLLDQAFGPARRHTVNHVPLVIDRAAWQEMVDRWAEDFARTRASRFRAKANVVPEYLYPHYLLATGRGCAESTLATYRDTFYHPLENFLPWAWYGLTVMRLLRPKTIALNDGFGDTPNPRVIALARDALERSYPQKSPYEA